MEGLAQYIDLYKEHAGELSGFGEAIDGLREGASDALEVYSGRPAPKSAYKEGGAEALLSPDYGVNLGRVNFDPKLAATFHCGVPNISTLLALTVNDIFRPTDLLLKQLPEGVTVCSLAEASRKGLPGVERLNGLAANGSPAAAVNSLLLQDGVYVHVDRCVHLDKPLQIVNIFNAPLMLMAVRRMLIVMEEGASARILICDHTQNREVRYLSNEVTEIYCGAGSQLEVYGIDESSALTDSISAVYASLSEGSSLTMCDSSLSGGVNTCDCHIDLHGKHARADISGLVIADGEQIKTTDVHLRHRASDCESRQLFKYALFDGARGSFGGKIVVDQGAVRTDASQTNRNLLAGADARMASAPQLEIYCDDVKCSHGATTGQFDDRALFYMQTRGIPQDQARMMLTQAFMADVVDHISYDLVRDRLRQLVERRLGGQSASCASCAASDQNCSHN